MSIKHEKLVEEDDSTQPVIMVDVAAVASTQPVVQQDYCFKCGKCLRRCCETDRSFCNTNGKDCRCTPLTAIEITCTGAAMFSMVTSLIGVGWLCCDSCASRRPPDTCSFCGWIITVWQGLLFVASWFLGLAVALLMLIVTMRISRKHGASCCKKSGCTSCARGFEETV